MATNSNNLVAADVATYLHGLERDRISWETGTYKASNDDLYGLLYRCSVLMEQLKGRPSLIAKLNAMLTSKNITYNDGTSLATKIARFVFNGDNKRITGYARVLRVAAEEKPENESFAAFVARKGGLEEVRKQKASGKLTKAEQAKIYIKAAQEYFVDSDSLVQDFACSSADVLPHAEADHHFSAALLRHNDDGTYSIVYGCNKVTVVKLLLAEGGKLAEEARQVQAMDALRDQQRAARDALRDMAA